MTVERPDAFLAGADSDRLLPWRRVKDLAGISRTTAWRLQKAGAFPHPVRISPGRVGWRESDVTAWRTALAPRRAAPAPAPPVSRPTPAPGPPVATTAPPPPGLCRPPSPAPVRPRGRGKVSRVSPDQLSFDF